ncbi:hypothetical protein ATERTT37_004633 [Aspergillus terreus]
MDNDLEVTIGKVQTIAPKFEAQHLAQEESLRVLSNELATTSTANSQLAVTLKETQAELRRLQADIRDRAVEFRNREAVLEANIVTDKPGGIYASYWNPLVAD